MPQRNELTAGDLARLAFPPGAEILSALETKSRPVKWAMVPGGDIQPAPADLLLLPVPPTMETLEASRAASVAGIAFIGHWDASLLLPSDLFLASLPTDVSLRALHQSVVRLLIDREAYLSSRASQIHQTLARHSLEGGGLQAMARAMLDLTGSSIVIHDKRLTPLAQAMSPGLSHGWAEMLEYLADSEHLPEGLQDRKRAAGLHTQTLPGGLARVVCPVVVKGVARGYLSIIGNAGDLDALAELVAEQGASACALEMARAKAVSETAKRLRGDFVDAVLDGLLSPAEAEARADRVGHDLDEPHAVVMWTWGSGEELSLRRLETAINGEVARLDLAASVLVRPRREMMLAVCEEGETARPEVALHLATAVVEAVAEESPDAWLFAGVGRLASDMAGWRASFREAEQSLAIARRVESETPLYFADLSVYRLLLQLEGHPELEAFTRDVLGPLLEYEGSADLLATLAAFFEHNGNISQTAEALYVHRNTLLYRMERIAEITKLDLENSETRLALHLALKALRLLKPT